MTLLWRSRKAITASLQDSASLARSIAARGAPRLESLELTVYPPDELDFEFIEHAPRLRSLSARGLVERPAGIEHLWRARRLKSLKLDGSLRNLVLDELVELEHLAVVDRFREITRDQHSAAVGERPAGKIRIRQLGELRFDFSTHRLAQARRGGDENRDGVGIVLGLGDKVGGDELRIPAIGEDDGFGGAGEHVDGAIGADEALGGGDEAIAGAEDFVHARDGFGAVGQRGYGLRAPYAGYRAHT